MFLRNCSKVYFRILLDSRIFQQQKPSRVQKSNSILKSTFNQSDSISRRFRIVLKKFVFLMKFKLSIFVRKS